MSSLTVRAVPSGDEAQAVATVVLAFAADPAARWSWANSHQYLTNMPSMVRAFGGSAFAHGTAYCTDECVGASLWLPPGVSPDEEQMEIVQSTFSMSSRNDAGGLFEQMAKSRPTEPYWYLPLIGVDPAHQGKGHGDALMFYALERCDRDHLPAYLESSNPRNLSLYERHDFRAIGTIQSGSSPTIVPMLRAAR